jgi:DNA (cytosine-5)-methyltransferase 1
MAIAVPTAVSLFAGCGGDTLGLAEAGFAVVGEVEKNRAARATHHLNFPDTPELGAEVGGDITRIPDTTFNRLKGGIDVLFAGFPCQGFSHAGKKDPNDPRNRLFWDFVRAAQLASPRWVVGENVSGLLKRATDDGKTPVSEVISRAFEEVGYRMAEPFVLNAADFGVPQIRRRVFFVGSREGLPFTPPPPTHLRHGRRGHAWVPIRDAIEFSLEGAIPFDPSRVAGGVPTFLESSSGGQPTGVPHPYMVLKADEGLLSFSKRDSPYHAEVVNLDSPAKTLHSGYSFQPRLFVPQRNRVGTFIRPFVPAELARLQGFPSAFRLSGSLNSQIVQVGNAVPPALSRAVALQIAACDSGLATRLERRFGLRAWEASAPTP